MQPINVPNHPVLQAIGNAALGPAGTAAKLAVGYGKNLYDQLTAPPTPEETNELAAHPVLGAADIGTKFLLNGPLAPVGGTAVNNFAEDLGHGNLPGAGGDLMGTIANLFLLKHGMGKSQAQRANALTAAVGADAWKPIDQTLSRLEATRQRLGLPGESVGDTQQIVKAAKGDINSQFGNAIGPFANQPFYPVDPGGNPIIPDRIRALKDKFTDITPEDRRAKAYIDKYATFFDKPHPLGELDTLRTRLNSELSKYNAKMPTDRYTARNGSLNLLVDSTLQDALRDTIYPKADQLAGAAPGTFENLKQQQMHLINLEDLLDHRIDELTGKSRAAAGTTPLSRARGGISLTESGRPHGYLSGLQDMVPHSVLHEADKAAARAFSNPGPVSRSLLMSYPARALMLNQTSNGQYAQGNPDQFGPQ